MPAPCRGRQAIDEEVVLAKHLHERVLDEPPGRTGRRS
jgi:hypothetical protein